mmetsp:Transcript_40445/g.49894  ORF Transcript_40445/g.49894 Transcript_40445/m.49894 type:complete len:246 (-) Transcript_40445:96-833(-)
MGNVCKKQGSLSPKIDSSANIVKNETNKNMKLYYASYGFMRECMYECVDELCDIIYKYCIEYKFYKSPTVSNSGNEFYKSPVTKDDILPYCLTDIEIGYSSISNMNYVKYIAPLFKKLYFMDFHNNKEFILDGYLCWPPNQDDYVKIHKLHLCDGINEWVNEINVYYGQEWDSVKYLEFKTNKNNIIKSYDNKRDKTDKTFEQLKHGLKLETIKPPNKNYKLCGIYGGHGYVLDSCGFIFVSIHI